MLGLSRRAKIFGLVLGLSLFQQVFLEAKEPKPDFRMEEAKKFFERYIELERNYDPAAADLYADTAVIRNTRRYPNGSVRVITIHPVEYKSLIVSTLPLARARGDKSTYSKINYIVEGNRVRIRCTRYSELKKYSSPMEIIAGPDENGTWKIYQEISESQP